MELSERFLSYIAARVLETRGEELKTLERDISKLEAIVPLIRWQDSDWLVWQIENEVLHMMGTVIFKGW